MKTLALRLGCCTAPPVCALCSPEQTVESLEVARVLLSGHRGPVATFGGPPPSDALLDLIAQRPLRIRVRPDLLDESRAKQLVQRGVTRIELDALTMSDRLLAWSGRHYRSARVCTMLLTLRGWGVQVGVVQAIGLPGSDEDDALRDTHRFATLTDTARLHPVLVIRGSGLAERVARGGYRPLDLDSAIGACAACLDVYESAGVTVVRVGAQPGPDGLGRAVAGPVHSALREEVEARRTLSRLSELLSGTPAGTGVVIHCAPQDISRTKGTSNHNLRVLRELFGLSSIEIRPDATLDRGLHRVRRAL